MENKEEWLKQMEINHELNAVQANDWKNKYLNNNKIHFKKVLDDKKVIIRIKDNYFICSFLGTGAINTWQKKGKELSYRGVSHPHLKWATFETMLCMAHSDCITANMTREELNRYFNNE